MVFLIEGLKMGFFKKMFANNRGETFTTGTRDTLAVKERSTATKLLSNERPFGLNRAQWVYMLIDSGDAMWLESGLNVEVINQSPAYPCIKLIKDAGMTQNSTGVVVLHFPTLFREAGIIE
ncbi:hypothetical protein [Siccibacter colletis]|uniref:hypothetical protein n=1 Tax=Siccibacter colletis TaxID=1505757 RepID=UPI003CEFCF82